MGSMAGESETVLIIKGTTGPTYRKVLDYLVEWAYADSQNELPNHVTINIMRNRVLVTAPWKVNEFIYKLIALDESLGLSVLEVIK